MPMVKLSVGVAVIFVLGGALGCGGGSSGSRTGTGGTAAGTGGATAGTGGATAGTGGMSSSAGTGGSTFGYACSGTGAGDAPDMNITDFSDGTSKGAWGTAPSTLTGGTFQYANTGGTLTGTIDTTAKNLHVAGTVAGYAGAGLYFNLCINASRFAGIQFTVAGNLGGCALELQVQTNSDKAPDATGMKGTCATTDCAFPSKGLGTTVSGQPTKVLWADVMGGKPTPFGTNGNMEIVGLQWQLTSATTCTADITIDDIVWIAPAM